MPIKYPETIFCDVCRDPVKMTGCRISSHKVKGRVQVEFDYVCVACGHRASAARDWEFLQFSEREYCRLNGLGDFTTGAKKKATVPESKVALKSVKRPTGKYS